MFSKLCRWKKSQGVGRRGAARAERRRAGSRRLGLEPLEDRQMLSVDLISGVADDTLLGTAASGTSDTERFSVSGDGRYAAFVSSATNLVTGDTNGMADIFVQDTETGEIVLASTSTDDAELANADCDQPALSGDGRYLVFRSNATNLVDDDTLAYSDIFLKDFQTGVTTRVSTTSAGGEAYDDSSSPAISSDGRYVAFTSEAANLAGSNTNGVADVFVKDLQTGLTTRVSTASDGTVSDADCNNAVLSSDGRYVAFESAASTLVASDTNGYLDVFVKDLQSGVTVSASTDADGGQASRDSTGASITSDGRYVAFSSTASDLVASDANGVADVFVKDLESGAVRLVSTNSTGAAQANSACDSAMITGGGTHVVFSTAANNLTTSDTNSRTDVFLKNLQTGSVTRVSQATGVQADGNSGGAWASDDGRYVLFSSEATNLADRDTNGASDVFWRDLQVTSLTLVSARNSAAAAPFSANGQSDSAVVSSDGRYVAFRSRAGNLIDGNGSDHADIFLRDMQTGEVRLVSSGLNDAEANADSESPSISSDGRYVAFSSAATNIVKSDTNSLADVFVKDMESGEIRRVSTDSVGNQAWGGDSANPALSADGLHIAFQSYATNLVKNDTNGFSDVFFKDLTAGTTTRMSTSTAGDQSNRESFEPAISGDGRYVAFQSSAGNLIDNDDNLVDVYRKDTLSGGIVRVSTSYSGAQGDNSSNSPSLSTDGRYVAFWSEAANLVAGDVNGSADVFVKDMVSGVVVIASTDSDGQQASNWSRSPSISGNGRYVTFVSYASDLANSDINGLYDVLVKDLVTGEIALASTGGEGVELANGHCHAPSINYSGRFVAFDSVASNLVATDGNGCYDVFRVVNSLNNVAPTDITLDQATLAENVADGTVVGTLAAVDTDDDELFTYTLLDNAGGRFTIVDDQLVVSHGWSLDFETNTSHQVVVEAADLAGETVDVTLTITITDLHDYASPGLIDPSQSTFYLRSSNSTGSADYTFGYGDPRGGWTALVGDWDGDGCTGVGFYDPVASMFYLTNSYSAGYAEYAFSFGDDFGNDIPLVGDWNGDGASGIGLYDPDTDSFRLTDTLAPLGEIYTFTLAAQSDAVPLVGDWNGDGSSGVGLYDPRTSTFQLVNSLDLGFVQYTFGYGEPGAGWKPLVGDWDGDRSAGVGLYAPETSTFYLRNDLTMGFADHTIGYGVPNAGWVPLVGDWNGDNQTGIGLYDPSSSTFYLTNRLASGYAESTLGYGQPNAGWQPLVGCWITPDQQQVSSTAATSGVSAQAVDEVDLSGVAAYEIERLRSSSIDDSDSLFSSTESATSLDVALASL